MGSKMINARGETLAEKPAFRAAYKRRRCLIPSTGFYEWQKHSDKTKTPMHIRLKSERLFAFAGLWEIWNSPFGDTVYSCTIITTEPNDLLKPIHDRMPVILKSEDFDHWLTPEEHPGDYFQHLIKPYPAEEMEAYPVSSQVNSPANDSLSLIQAI